MKHPDYLKELFLIVLLLIPIIYLGIIWNSLPDIMPTNFAADGTPDHIGYKGEFLLLMIFLFFTNLLLYFLFRYIPKVDDDMHRSAAPLHAGEYYRIRLGIHLYLAIFSCFVVLLLQLGYLRGLEKWAFAGVGILIIVLGYYLGRLRPNYFVGVRTPWTLLSNEVWQRTHEMAGRLWMTVGAVVFLAGFFLPVMTGVFLIFVAVVLLSALPYIYSFRLYNRDKG
ncbi:SdpI family protein [Chitinophaga horti]|uniref:SdpI family protein n=1 Tax=Chitinophaga horti TaxID=2920382 RepID=A0ABY6IXC0_9BACT|nr:SdpI family protein [Chitinophaga horti]UYQ91846.1 SdpI family protein [Chitinophaga horti]